MGLLAPCFTLTEEYEIINTECEICKREDELRKGTELYCEALKESVFNLMPDKEPETTAQKSFEEWFNKDPELAGELLKRLNVTN